MICRMVIGTQVSLSSRLFSVEDDSRSILGGAESIGATGSAAGANKIRKQVVDLQEENNMLKLKVEVLLNLVAESIAELSSSHK